MIFPEKSSEIHITDDRLAAISEKMRAIVVREGIENIEYEAKLGTVMNSLNRRETDELTYQLVQSMLSKDNWDILPNAKLLVGDRTLYGF